MEREEVAEFKHGKIMERKEVKSEKWDNIFCFQSSSEVRRRRVAGVGREGLGAAGGGFLGRTRTPAPPGSLTFSVRGTDSAGEVEK